MSKPLQMVFLFVSMLLLQVLILNKVQFMGYINPYLYIVFVLVYPIKINRFPFLIFAFLLGLLIDTFTNSGGIHAFATLFIAYIRLFFIKSIFKKTESDYQSFSLSLESFDKVFNYVAILTVIHHFILFILINFGFNNFINVLLNTIFSTIFTLILYFLGRFLFTKKHS